MLRVNWTGKVRILGLAGITGLLSAGCRMVNPAFERLSIESHRNCEAPPGCGETGSTHGSMEETNSSHEPLDDSSGTGSELATKSVEEDSQTPSEPSEADRTSSDQSDSSSASTSQSEDLPEFALACIEGTVNCYTMKFDDAAKNFVARGQGPMVLKSGDPKGAPNIETQTTEGAFGHTWVTNGDGYGLISNLVSTAGFDGIGIDLRVRNLSCSGSSVCYFAALEGVLSVGYMPQTSAVVCKTNKGLSTSKGISKGANVRIACSLSEEKMLLRIDNDGENSVSPGEKIEKSHTAPVVGPSVVPTVSFVGGVAFELAWVRVWKKALALEGL